MEALVNLVTYRASHTARIFKFIVIKIVLYVVDITAMYAPPILEYQLHSKHVAAIVSRSVEVQAPTWPELC